MRINIINPFVGQRANNVCDVCEKCERTTCTTTHGSFTYLNRILHACYIYSRKRFFCNFSCLFFCLCDFQFSYYFWMLFCRLEHFCFEPSSPNWTGTLYVASYVVWFSCRPKTKPKYIKKTHEDYSSWMNMCLQLKLLILFCVRSQHFEAFFPCLSLSFHWIIQSRWFFFLTVAKTLQVNYGYWLMTVSYSSFSWCETKLLSSLWMRVHLRVCMCLYVWERDREWVSNCFDGFATFVERTQMVGVPSIVIKWYLENVFCSEQHFTVTHKGTERERAKK